MGNKFQTTPTSKTKAFAAENIARPFTSILRTLKKYSSSYPRGKKIVWKYIFVKGLTLNKYMLPREKFWPKYVYLQVTFSQ